MAALFRLLAEVDRRVASIRENRPDWLCGKGCDGCCQRLAEIPQLHAAEWDLLRQGLAGLTPQHLQQIDADMAALASQTVRPLTCPLLDRESGACPVYAQRPVACRTYGFYVQRDKGVYCSEIEAQVDAGALSDVVWGNHDAVDQSLAGLGERRLLTEWYAEWRAER
ncbi:YkgJ family cysteine cluster protein [Quatrionicoccus australiensis]|uniref:YkgJ family cysteine cluster protein n=1 Tax=Quatrionicoccus australiensis TaxID=138118 RepID=UPI001CF92B03|nr:YkgJ family cysteine cluster protein [Quatrionicoccus australiensis]UCV13620.1 YkgJ family cysteine cluster protein [Quatrionicoccus australiensis]